MRKYSIGLFSAAMLLSIAAYAAATCPIDGGSSYFTGNTRVDGPTGKLLYEHRCPRGHTFWSTST